MNKPILTVCLVLLVPMVGLYLLLSFLYHTEFDWEFIYIQTIFTIVLVTILLIVNDIKGRRVTVTKLNYTATVQSEQLIVLFVFFVFNSTVTVEGLEVEVLIIRIIVLALIILLASLRFKFYIEENILTYEIFLFTFLLYKRRVSPDEIKQVKFIRTGWAKKGAIIKLKKGLSLRIVNFEPTNVCPDLNAFTDKHSISSLKTNDYILLDKKSRQSAGERGSLKP